MTMLPVLTVPSRDVLSKSDMKGLSAKLLRDSSWVGIDVGQVVQTMGFALPGDGGGAHYKGVSSEPSHDGKVQSSDGQWWEYLPDPGQETINLAAFGAVVDTATEAASTANNTAIENAVSFADAKENPNIALPRGTLWIKADNGTSSGLIVDVPDNQTVKFWGAGSVIKRLSASSLSATSGLVFMRANAGVTIEWHNVTFDGNEANCELDSNANAFTGDGSTTVYSYAGTGEPVVSIDNGDGTFSDSDVSYTVTGSSGAWTVTFSAATTLGTDYIIYNEFKHEQSGNIKWLSGTGTPHALRFFNCDVGKNRVGDGYHANVIIDHFMATGCSTTDAAVRRSRSDWQFSRYPTYSTIMGNIDCNSFESEPSFTSETSRLFLSNINAASRFDLAGDVGGTTQRPVVAQLANVRCDYDASRSSAPSVNFSRVHGEAVNCHFRGVSRMQRCKLTMRGGSLTVRNAGSGVADAIVVWHDQSDESDTALTERTGNFVKFVGVRFLKDSDVTSGQYVEMNSTATTAGQLGDHMVRTSIIDCRVEVPLDYVAYFYRCGEYEIRGGDLQANTAIVQFGNTTGFVSRLVCEASPIWNAPNLLRIPSNIDFAGSELHISGTFDGDVMEPINGSDTSQTNLIWGTSAVMTVTSSPDTNIPGFPGLRARNAAATSGQVTEWLFDGDDEYGQTGWSGILTKP